MLNSLVIVNKALYVVEAVTIKLNNISFNFYGTIF